MSAGNQIALVLLRVSRERSLNELIAMDAPASLITHASELLQDSLDRLRLAGVDEEAYKRLIRENFEFLLEREISLDRRSSCAYRSSCSFNVHQCSSCDKYTKMMGEHFTNLGRES